MHFYAAIDKQHMIQIKTCEIGCETINDANSVQLINRNVIWNPGGSR